MHTSEFEVLEVLRKPCCAICKLASKSARDYLAGVLADGVNDPGVRDDWRRRGGLCGRHWRVWRGLESPALSSAIIAQDLLGSYLAKGFPEKIDCRACQTEREAEKRYLQALRNLPHSRLDEALEAGQGFLCLRHLGRLPDSRLREAFQRRLEAILEDLAEFIRKSDYRFSDEPRGAEGNSWLRAIRALGGEV